MTAGMIACLVILGLIGLFAGGLLTLIILAIQAESARRHDD